MLLNESLINCMIVYITSSFICINSFLIIIYLDL